MHLGTVSSLRLFLSLCIFVMVALSYSSAFAGLGASVTLVTGQPTAIKPGEVTQLEITLSNNNTGAPITAVGFSNSLPGTLPNGLKISGVPTYNCTDPAIPATNPGVGVLTAVDGTQAISLVGGVIPARANSEDGTCIIVIPVTAGSSTGNAATYSYQIANGAVTGDDGAPVANSGSVSQSVNVQSINRPVIGKSFGSNTLILGGNATTLTISVSNSNDVPIPDFSITDNFPLLGGSPIIKVATPVVSNSTCTGAGTPATFTPVAGATSVTATGGTVAANGSCTITVSVEANQTDGLYLTGYVNNTIVGATDFSNDLGIIPQDSSALIRTQSPLNVVKAFANPQIASGQSDTFSVVFTNTSLSPLVIDSFTDSPIDGVGNAGYGLKTTGVPTVSCTGAGVAGTYARTAGDFGIIQTADTTIAPGETCTVTASFTATAQTPNVPISFTNLLPEGIVGTVTPGIVSQTTSSSILVSDELRILKTSVPTVAAVGNPVRHTVTVQNWSASVINNITTVDTLANGQTFLTGTIGGVNYTPTMSGSGCATLTVPDVLGAPSVSMTIGTLPARPSSFVPGSCVLTFWAMVDPAAADLSPITNVVPPNAVCYGGGPTCNGSASPTTTLTADADTLTAVKAFTPAGPLAENTITTMTIVFSNLSVNDMTAISVTDNLPSATIGSGQMRVATPPNAASTCGTPTITAVADSTSITMNGATIPARVSSGLGAAGTCVLQVDVVGPAGNYNNTATMAGTQTYANGTSVPIGPVNTTTANLIYTSAISANKSFAPASVSSGGMSQVNIRLFNAGAIPLSGVSVVDSLPVGMVLANPVNAQTTCAGTTSFVGAPGASSFTMTGGEVSGSGTCDVLFDVVATGAANWVNTIPVGNISATGGIINQLPVTGTLVFDAPTGITVAKATSPSTLTFPGQVSQMTVTLDNGNTDVTNLSFTDYFTVDGTSGATTNGMQVAPNPSATTTCPGGIVTAVPGGTFFSLSGATLENNKKCNVKVNIISIIIGGITNFIPIGAIQTDQGLSNSGAATTSLTTQGNLGVTKQFTPGVIKPGERSRLRITFLNPTTQPASNISVVDNLPAGVTVPIGANPITTCTGASITSPVNTQVDISGANILAASGGVSGSCYSEIDVTAAAVGDYTNTIPIGTVTGTIGGAPSTNLQPVTDILRVKIPLVINKAIGGFTLDAGDPAGFTTGVASRAVGATAPLVISITNPNVAPLTETIITDALPTGLVVAQTPAASTTCTDGIVNAPASATSITLSGATIPATGSCTVTVDVLSNIIGNYTNTIPASDVSTLEGITNEEPTQAQVIIASPPTVTKEFAPAVMAAGGVSTMTINLGNENNGPLTLITPFTDNLPTAPGNMLVAPTPNITKTCPGAVTAVAGTGTITYANGAQIPAGGCSISVDITAAIPGVHTNNIPAGRLQTDLGGNPFPANAELTVSTFGFISGRVFLDNNVVPNGIFDSGLDDIISGVPIELRSGGTCAGALLETKNSDATGNYVFSLLLAGTYSVCQTAQPFGTDNGITTAGIIVPSNGSTGTPGVASNPTATTSQIVGIVLNNDGAVGETSGSTGNDFPETAASGISGRVFLDENNNAVQNGPDLGIAGITIELLDGVGTVITTQVTDALGDYSFPNLLPGTYSIRQPAQPADTNNGITIAGTVANGGTAGTVTAPNVVPSEITGIILPPNTTTTANNFAEIPKTRSITGSLFLDYNNNGAEDGFDYGLAGMTLNLTGLDINATPVAAVTTTVTNGTYSFTELPEGTYTVSQSTQPLGTTNGITTAGTTGGVASNPTATSSQIVGIDLTGTNTLSAGNNFPEVPVNSPDLTITKTHTPTSFAAGSDTGLFTITPRNIGAAATTGTITLTDTLPAGMTLTATPTGTGWSCVGAGGASAFTCTSTTSILANSLGNPVSFRVTVAPAAVGQILVNQALVAGGGEPPGFDGNNATTDSVVISITSNVSGTIWRDADHDRQIDPGEEPVEGWVVELLFGGTVFDTETTAVDGSYTFSDVSPGTGYEIRFREPATGQIFGNAIPNEQGIAPASGTRDTGGSTANVAGTNTGNPAGADTATLTGTLTNLTILAGDNIIEQSLPLDPAGIVYNAITRNPVANAQVTITGPGGFNPAAHLVGGQGTVTTGLDGFYQFLLLPAAPVGIYTLEVTTYPGGFAPAESLIIPACTNTLTVNAVPDPALVHVDADPPVATSPIHDPATCPAATAALAPANQASTQYYFSFDLNALTSGDLVNNHIPLDPVGITDILVTKTTPVVNTSVGQLVPYTIAVRNTSINNFSDVNIIDTLPPGFKYQKGSGSLDGVKFEPTVSGRSVVWANQALPAGITKTYKIITVVGSGVQPGEYVNSARVLDNQSGVAISNVGTAIVRVIPDPVFDCSDIIGKVFDDKNTNGYQDQDEPGIANVRIATLTGLLVTTDAEGRFHVACAAIPDAERGSNFLMKLDERTLPTGYRITTENPRAIRVSRGKMAKLNFGAAIHRVVRIDMQDSAFISGELELKPKWLAQMKALPDNLQSGPTVVRLAYQAAGEGEDLARKRLKNTVKILRDTWEALECCHEIMIEEELMLPPENTKSGGGR